MDRTRRTHYLEEEQERLRTVVSRFRHAPGTVGSVVPFESGLINDTYEVTIFTPANEEEEEPGGGGDGGDRGAVRFDTVFVRRYVLQRLNPEVFPDPSRVMSNIERVTLHLAGKVRERGGDATRETLTLVPTITMAAEGGGRYHHIEEEEEGGGNCCWRMYDFVGGAKTAAQVIEERATPVLLDPDDDDHPLYLLAGEVRDRGGGGDETRETSTLAPTTMAAAGDESAGGEKHHRIEEEEEGGGHRRCCCCRRMCDFVSGASTAARVIEERAAAGTTIDDDRRRPDPHREVGATFARFQRDLLDLPGPRLHETIPGFGDPAFRFGQFHEAIAEDRRGRAGSCDREVEFCLRREREARTMTDLLEEGRIPERVVHFDTKTDNVLLDDATGVGLCTIDLDTVMPGPAIYDFGDCVRSAAARVAEDEPAVLPEFGFFSIEIFESIAEGYLSVAGSFLSPEEVDHLVLASRMVTLTMGVRFLTDYLNGDVYYKTSRENHNLDRARTQLKMVAEMEAKSEEMDSIIRRLRVVRTSD